MAFVVDDLLDFALLNNNKFRKNIQEFDLKACIREVVKIQQEKASMMGISLNSFFKPQ
jgi:signal transduction histidine kinase